MSDADEKIIQVLNGYKKDQYGDIYTGITIKEALLEFKAYELLDGKMSMMLPDTFTDMPIEIAKIKYPMEQRPQIIKMNAESNINFTFSLLDVALKKKDVKEVIDGLYNVIKSTQPSNVFYEKKVEALNDTLIGWFDFKGHGIDQKIYNLMYCTPIDGKLLHGIFNCPLQDAQAWKPCVLQVIQSIKDLTIYKGDENA